MKLFKNTLTIVALFAIGSVCARIMDPAKPVAARGTAKPTVQPVSQGKTYKQLRDEVLRMKQADVIDGSKKLSAGFIDKMKQQIAPTGLGPIVLKGILQTARDKFAPFTGDDTQDLQLLMAINQQIADAIELFV